MSEGTSEKRGSHPIRLALLMLLGAHIGYILSPTAFNALDPWSHAAPYINAIIGSVSGLGVELCLRCVLAIAWAIVH